MTIFDILLTACLAYAALLFGVAFLAERLAQRGQAGWLRGPAVYTLSLSIYCTAWTFYGAVGYAARSGLEFATIYLGPTLVVIGWWGLLRKMVRVGRAQRITSVADMVSSRFGKSAGLGGLVTVLAVVTTTPYIALQLQSVTLSFAAFAGPDVDLDLNATTLWVALGLAVFSIVFGTRKLDANERHPGIVTAIALEAVVKLLALIAVGTFVIWGVAGGPAATFAAIEDATISTWDVQPGRWAGLTFLSAAAFLCLPRMFHVLVVENSDERHLATASWAFPLYLLAMSLFVVPIAAVGLGMAPGIGPALGPASGNPDLYVLTIPLSEGRSALALFAFLGGFSSATSMVIVAAIALATMVSNHIVLPLWMRSAPAGALMSGDVRDVVILSRRIAILGVLALGWLYYRLSGGGTALASIGLVSFVGIVQVLPPLVGGLYWRGATRGGAAAGLAVGFVVWIWTLFLPSFGSGAVIADAVLDAGPWGIGFLRPQALFGISGLDPVVHALLWSLALNTGLFVGLSLMGFPTPVERMQGAAFVNAFGAEARARGWSSAAVAAEDLLIMAQRLLGPTEAQTLFHAEASRQGVGGYLPEVTPDFLERLERELSGSVGAATAHAMIAQITGGGSVSVEELMRVADEAAQIMEYSARLESQSAELARTARQLREANEKLTALSVQKDAFLGQISHELRTPMTSVRAFSELLREEGGLEEADRRRFADIIHDEATRLTRLLDDLLDLSVLSSGQVTLRAGRTTLGELIDRALAVCDTGHLRIHRAGDEQVEIRTDPDRLAQVLINLVTNSRKYASAERPELRIVSRRSGKLAEIDVIDNGPGIPHEAQAMIFEKFARLGRSDAAGGAGLGLAICREVMARLGGTIVYLPGQGGAAFRVALPLEAGPPQTG